MFESPAGPITTLSRQMRKDKDAEVKRLFDYYYNSRGWDLISGIPKRETLEAYDLNYVASELSENMPYPEWVGPPLWSLDKYPHNKL
jgi:aldehyde:ferredoxin oxidoreductase